MAADGALIIGRLMSDTRFWVFFDTATRPEYYQDVHKVLALPRGALLEYQYRDLRMEPEVVEATRRPVKQLPSQALIAYAQWTEFKRGDPDPEGAKPAEEMRYQATRLAELVALWRDGERAVFQFRLEGHPRADPDLLVPIIEDLASRSAVPYEKWVAFSTAAAALTDLTSADPVADWQQTVDRLVARPMQFTGDKFLRFDPPRRNRFWAPSELRSKYPRRAGHAQALDHRYVVPERCEFGLRISTHEPVGATRGGVSDAVATYEVEVPADGPLLGPVPAAGTLRRTSDTTILFESKHSAKTERKVGTVTISSSDALPAVAAGISFSFALKLAAWKRALGVCLWALGAASIALSAILTASNEIGVGATILMTLAGILIGAAGGFLYTGRWSFKT
jgi:hypothetical protein